MKLTDKAVKAAEPRKRFYKLTDGQGLFLLVMPNGSKYWRLRYRYADREKLLAVGIYPEVSLKEARERKAEAKKLLEQNIDPAIHKKKERALAFENSLNTFEKLALEWHKNWKQGHTEKHAITIRNRLEADVFPHIGGLPVAEITPPMILEIIRKVEQRGAYDVARRIKQTCGQIFRYGVAAGSVERDITADLKEAMRPYKMEHSRKIQNLSMTPSRSSTRPSAGLRPRTTP